MTRHYWDKKKIAFLRKHAKGKPFRELTALFNKAFSLSLTESQVKSGCYYHGIKTGFRKDRGFQWGNNAEERILPIWTEKVFNRRYGEIYVKVSMEGWSRQSGNKKNGGWQGTWVPKHYLIWERVNGPKPAHHLIIFADQNKRNFALKNLLLISKREYFYMIKNGLLSNNTEVTRANHAVAKHKLAIFDAVKRLTGCKRHYAVTDKLRRSLSRNNPRKHLPERKVL